MPDDLLLPGIFWATDIANDLISGAGGQLSALISDELWSLVGANSNPLAAGYIQEMVKTIRGLGGIMKRHIRTFRYRDWSSRSMLTQKERSADAGWVLLRTKSRRWRP